eukprot:EG_transcript_6687
MPGPVRRALRLAAALLGLLCLPLAVWRRSPGCPIPEPTARQRALILVSATNLSNASCSVVQPGIAVARYLRWEVDVALPEDAAVAALCRSHNFTVVRQFPSAASYAQHAAAARQQHEQARYSLLVWLVGDLAAALPHLAPLPASAAALWVLGSSAPATPLPPPQLEQLLRFDVVWFASKPVLRATSRLVNPLGHRPPSFRLLGPGCPADRLAALLQDVADPATPTPLPAPALARPFETPSSRLSRASDTCPLRKQVARVALAVHLAARPVAWLRPVFHAMRHIEPVSSHLWLTVFADADRQALSQAVAAADVVCHPLTVRNKGLDIGPFFVVLWQIAACRYNYDFILKYHFKSKEQSPWSVHASMFFYYPDFLRVAVEALDRHPGWAAVYPNVTTDFPVVMPDTHFLFDGMQHVDRDGMQELSAALGLPPWPRQLISGTVFFARMRAFSRLGGRHRLWRFYLQLTDIGGLDWRWYNQHYFKGRCSRRAVEWHHRHRSAAEGYHGNVYAIPTHQTICRDGMVEHAWERVLSFMISAEGALAPLAVPYRCAPPQPCPSFRGTWDPNPAALAAPDAPLMPGATSAL